MLIQQQQQAVAARPAKQIAIRCNTANAVIYTVPKGRKFIGSCYGTYASVICYINGVGIGYTFSGYSNTDVPSTSAYPNALTLLEGTTVSFSEANKATLLGVEYDA